MNFLDVLDKVHEISAETVDPTHLFTLPQVFGRGKDDAVHPIALANLVLHGIGEPRLWHENTLTSVAAYEELFRGAPAFFDYVLMNPPFGGKEGKEAQTPVDSRGKQEKPA